MHGRRQPSTSRRCRRRRRQYFDVRGGDESGDGSRGAGSGCFFGGCRQLCRESSSGGSPSEESEEDGESGESDDDNESDDDGGDSFHDDIESERQESLDPYVRLGLKAPLPPAPLLTAAAALGARLQGCSEQKRPSWSSAHLQEEEVEAERKANDVSLAALESKQPLDSHLRGGRAVATAAAEKAEPQQPRSTAPEEQRQRVAPSRGRRALARRDLPPHRLPAHRRLPTRSLHAARRSKGQAG